MINNERTNSFTRGDEAMTKAALGAMLQRGLVRPEELLKLSTPVVVLAWCRWWDDQRGAGTGLLAERIRSGQSPPEKPKTMLQREKEYGDSIAAWLEESFPDLCVPSPHPAAVATVIRLHYTEGKGKLTVAEHGPIIRAAVERFQKEMV